MVREKFLLIGANGQVGQALQSALAPLGEVVCLTRAQLDLATLPASAVMPEALLAQVQRCHPTVIVNACAHTAVDRAETEPQLAHLLNARVPGWLATLANQLDACLVHYSTDYVFDGIKSGYYRESDPTHPQSVYGRTKLQGEQAVALACPRHLIFRTSWVLSAQGVNFLKTMLRLAQERDALTIVSDQVGAPTTAELIAKVTSQVLTAMLKGPAGTQDTRWGTYHLAASGETNWFAYAQYMLEQARAQGWSLKVTADAIKPIATADHPFAARRPLNSRLDTAKLRQTFELDLPPWQSGVHHVLSALKSG